jgi:AcrR family transcriptional regulator
MKHRTSLFQLTAANCATVSLRESRIKDMGRTLDVAKKAAIFNAANNIFSRDGYAEAKMTDIAAEAGVAPGTLYLYFENKEALANAIGDEFFSRVIDEFGNLIENIEDPEGIAAVVDYAAEVAFRYKDVLAMVKERHRVRDEKKRGEKKHRFVSRLSEALQKLISQGTIRPYDDINTLAEMVLAIMRRLIMSQAVFGDENIDSLKAGAVLILQHVFFDDISLAAYKLIKQKAHNKANQ